MNYLQIFLVLLVTSFTLLAANNYESDFIRKKPEQIQQEIYEISEKIELAIAEQEIIHKEIERMIKNNNTEPK